MRPLIILLILLSLIACQSQTDETQPVPKKAEVSKAPEKAITTPTEPKKAEELSEEQEQPPTPPTPPLFENFQEAPKISLFPRTGAFRPEDDDEKGLQFWRTYIDHLTRTSGPIKTGKDDEAEKNIAFGFRSIKGIDSIGLFSPIAVTPDTTYQVEALFNCELKDGASTGIGILEFNEFLWIGEQFSESMAEKYQTGVQEGVQLTGKIDNQVQSFNFTTSPETKMIHLLFFRNGVEDRSPVVIDDIGIKEVEQDKS